MISFPRSVVHIPPTEPMQFPGMVNVFALQAVTTAPVQTVTLQRITPTGANVTVGWGDGESSIILNGNTGTTTHVYAAAGTYNITISGPAILTYIDLRDTKLTINSATLAQCVALTSLRLDIGGTFNSANIVGLQLTLLSIALTITGTYIFDSTHIAIMPLTILSISVTVAGTYTFNSSHIAAMTLTYLNLNMQVTGTYTFNSSHIAAMALTILALTLIMPGTYTFNSSHIAARTTITYILVMLHATNTVDVARADWDNFPALGTLRFEAALVQAEVDAILLGLYDGFAAKTVTGGTVDLLGQGNAAPSGILQAQCPPTTGKEAAYELVNDSCAVSTKHWISVTTA